MRESYAANAHETQSKTHIVSGRVKREPFRPAQSARAALSGLDFGDRIVGNNLNEAQRNLLVGQGHLHRSAPAVLSLGNDLGDWSAVRALR